MSSSVVLMSSKRNSTLRMSFGIHFAARDVELRLIDVRADGLAAGAYASGQFQGDVTPAAANIEAQLPVFETEAIKQ